MQGAKTTDVRTTDVLIVGAGPTGLTAALVLAQSGVGVRIVERDAGPINESRAMIVHARTQELCPTLAGPPFTAFISATPATSAKAACF